MIALHTAVQAHGPSAAPRTILPLDQWPSSDQCLWLQCCDGQGPFGMDNRAFRWGTRRCKIVEDAYGRFLGWRKLLGDHEPVTDPAARITLDAVAAFIKHMDGSGLSSVSIGMQIGALCSIAQAFAPDADWSWLKRKYFRQKHRAIPSREKRTRVVPSAALYALGVDLMETATDGARHAQPFFAASQYRDGLIIALMAARPLRIRNFQDIELHRTLVFRSGTYRLVFGDDETKTGRPIDVDVPHPLTPYLDRYLGLHRTVLLNKRPAGTKQTTALWVSRSGQKMQEPAMRSHIERRTKTAFGHAINPHLFRDCAATSFATDDPAHVRCIAAILGHASLSTSEKHYNQATMLTAVRTFSSTIMKIRNDLLEIFDDKAVRAFLVQTQQVEGPDDGI
jgi:integrase/recombinase XerD